MILYGQSVGSGPTLHLASRSPKLRGVVLHSAILSGIRVLYPVKMTFWFDIFKVSSTWLGSLLLLHPLVSWFFVLRISCVIFSEYRQNTASQLPCSSNTCEFPFFCSWISFNIYSFIYICTFYLWGLLPIDRLRYLPVIVGMVSYITSLSPPVVLFIALKSSLVLFFLQMPNG